MRTRYVVVHLYGGSGLRIKHFEEERDANAFLESLEYKAYLLVAQCDGLYTEPLWIEATDRT